MALEYVGGTTGSHTGSASYTVSLTGLTGGLASAPAEGDIVIAAAGQTGNGNVAVDVNSSGWTKISELFSDDSRDANFAVFYKVMGATPDTSIEFAVIQYPHTCAIHVWRGVDTTTPLDVTSTTATGINGSRADAPSITPVTSGAVIIACGHGTEATGAFTGPSGMSNFLQSQLAPLYEGTTGIASYSGWTSGAYNPAAWTGGTSGTSDSWAALTLVLRPATEVSVGLTGTSSTVSVGNLGVTESDNVSISGEVSNISQGDITLSTTLSLTGDQGQISSGVIYTDNTLNLTGFQFTSTPGSVQVSTDNVVDIYGIQASTTIGNTAYTEEENAQLLGISSVSYSGIITGSLTISISGVQSTTQIGDLTTYISYGISGFESTSTTGSIGVSTDSNLDLSGQSLTQSIGNVGYSETDNVVLSGVALSSSLGNLSKVVTLELSGEQLTSSTGSVVVDNNIQQVGYEITTYTGSVAPTTGVVRELIGITLSTSTGDVGVTETDNPSIAGSNIITAAGSLSSIDIMVAISGLEAQSTNGNVYVDKSFNLSGFEVTSTTGIIGTFVTPDIVLTGSSATSSPGSIGSTADLNNVSGISSTIELGSTSTNLVLAISGLSINSSTGILHIDKSFSINGFEITSSLGQVEDNSESYLPISGVSASTGEGSIGTYTESSININGQRLVTSAGELANVKYISLSGSQSITELGVAKSTPLIGMSGSLSEITIGDTQTHTDSNITLTGLERISSSGSIGAFSHSYLQLNGQTASTLTSDLSSVERYITLAGQNSESVVGYINPNIGVSLSGYEVYGYTSTNIIIENEVYVFLTPTPSISSVLLTIAAIRGLDLTNTVKVSEAKRNWSVVSEERNWVVKGFRRDWRVFSEIRNWKIKSDWIK